MSVSIDNRPIMVFRNCPGTLGDVNPLRNKGLRFPPRRKLASKRVQNTTLGAIAQKNTSIYQWVGVPGQLPFILSRVIPALTTSSSIHRAGLDQDSALRCKSGAIPSFTP